MQQCRNRGTAYRAHRLVLQKLLATVLAHAHVAARHNSRVFRVCEAYHAESILVVLDRRANHHGTTSVAARRCRPVVVHSVEVLYGVSVTTCRHNLANDATLRLLREVNGGVLRMLHLHLLLSLVVAVATVVPLSDISSLVAQHDHARHLLWVVLVERLLLFLERADVQLQGDLAVLLRASNFCLDGLQLWSVGPITHSAVLHELLHTCVDLVGQRVTYARDVEREDLRRWYIAHRGGLYSGQHLDHLTLLHAAAFVIIVSIGVPHGIAAPILRLSGSVLFRRSGVVGVASRWIALTGAIVVVLIC
ncbi:hypothetical protein, conserved [Leishmania tarentolae]|uniref:Uncharacterized protein n=1 Tax=Leishmania tarentolae TaxID=5689 RepID=A0A640KEW3_LEITA|nr:hypothetical protein, conserved [Leishmania tarentolae]